MVSVGLFRRRGNAVAQNPRRHESRRVRADGIGGAEREGAAPFAPYFPKAIGFNYPLFTGLSTIALATEEALA